MEVMLVDGIDLLWAVVIGLVTGSGAGWVLRRRGGRRHVWAATIGLAMVAAMLGSLLAGAVGVGDRPGFEPVERLLQVVFAVATLLSLRPFAPGPHR